ncbi:MAG TPA: SHOCT domain-containing protein, partial [Methanocella sp.]|nr:SHOCT domain-containing protein [Methanocella sp.]
IDWTAHIVTEAVKIVRPDIEVGNMIKISKLTTVALLYIALFCVLSASSVAQSTSSGDNSTLHIVSGTGHFSSVSSNKTIVVSPGEQLKGEITMETNNRYPDNWSTPTIGTPSWGNASISWWQISNSTPTGKSNQTTQINLTAPETPGTYYIIFAVSCEQTGSQVASATDWHNKETIWNDGNDLADLNASQITQLQTKGFVTSIWLGENKKYEPADTIGDALVIVVNQNTSGLAGTEDNRQPAPTPASNSNFPLTTAAIALGLLVIVFIAAVAVILMVTRRSVEKTHEIPAAPIPIQQPFIPRKASMGIEIAEKMKSLRTLREQGSITDEEFEEKRREILGKF